MPLGSVETKFKIQKSQAAQNLETLSKGQVAIPKWAVVVASTAIIASATIFVASMVIVNIKTRDGLYNETCATRSCSKGLGLKCIDKICLCPDKQFYRDRCRNLSTYDEPCLVNTECQTDQLLVCQTTKCGCDKTKYWSTIEKKCVNRKTYNEGCNGDECKTQLNLFCNSGAQKCDCISSETQYWNGTYCSPKKTYHEYCSLSRECLDSEKTQCLNSLCSCNSTEYFKMSESKCTPRVGEFETCSYDEMCLTPMFCSIKFGCRCPKYYFYNVTTKTCSSQYFLGYSCNTTNQCRDDLGLSCINKKCSCLAPVYTWSSISSRCLLTYSQIACTSDLNCNDAENLICRAHDCNCPKTSLVGMCDCRRNASREEYWNGTSCVLAKTLNSSCTFNYECRTIIESTVCLNGLCSCSNNSLFYWDNTKCQPKKALNNSCVSTYQCLDSQFTTCNGTHCVCKKTEYYSSLESRCLPRVGEYQLCNSNEMCLTPMLCRMYGSIGYCACSSNQFYENVTSTCPNKFSYLERCDRDLNCEIDYGLRCLNNKCGCSSNNATWSSTASKCLLTYSQQFCLNASYCNSDENLICQTNQNQCNCPASSIIGMCDCKRNLNFEDYWDGYKCVRAKAYGNICAFDYECQTLTQNTICSNNFCNCKNLSLEFWDGLKCVNKKKYWETCSNNFQCLDSELTYCNSFRCMCTNKQYFSSSQRKCVPRLGELQSCTSPVMCLSDMTCNSTNCLCTGNKFYENTTSLCTSQFLNNQYCDRDLECRIDLGLACISNRCVCASSKHTWSQNSSRCLLTYGESFCVTTSDCNTDQNLKCIDEDCNCPKASNIGVCDCKRILNTEEYWNNTHCATAKTYGQSCLYNYECQTLTQNTFCLSGVCQCSNIVTEYWNGSRCSPKRVHLESCSANNDCLDSQLTNCTGSICACRTTTYFDEVNQKCVNRLSEFSTCVNSTMCYEAMSCDPVLKKCYCPTNSYFKLSLLSCLPKQSFNGICDTDWNCLESQSLICNTNKICTCTSSYTWDYNAVKCKLTYAKGACSGDSDCNSFEGLSCTGGSGCKCPLTTTTNTCDCKRTSGNEQYWDGSKCVSAKDYNLSCNNTYECQTLNKLMTCRTGICQCDANSGYVSNKCVSCLPDEKFFENMCYFFYNGSTDLNRGDSKKACETITNRDLAIVRSNSVLNFFKLNTISPNDYWLSKKDNSFKWETTGTTVGNYCPLNGGGKDEINFDTITGCFDNDRGGGDHLKYICERAPS